MDHITKQLIEAVRKITDKTPKPPTAEQIETLHKNAEKTLKGLKDTSHLPKWFREREITESDEIHLPYDKAYAPKYGETSTVAPPRHRPYWVDKEGHAFSPVYWDNPEDPAVPGPGLNITAIEDKPIEASGYWTTTYQPSQYPHETAEQYHERMTGRIDKPTLANPNPPRPKQKLSSLSIAFGVKPPGYHESHSWTERIALQKEKYEKEVEAAMKERKQEQEQKEQERKTRPEPIIIKDLKNLKQ